MNRTLKLAICVSAGIMMQSAIVAPANAAYLGYGNGDPGNWDLTTEQAGGPCGIGSARGIDPATGQPKCCAAYNPASACPLALAPPVKYYRQAGRRLHHS
jgi:hypothetical protein